MGRAWAISGTAVLLGAAGHTLAGASAPHLMLLILCTALGALMSLGLLLVMSRMRNRIPQALTAGTALGAVAVQALLHTLFNLSHTPSLAGEHIAAAHAGTAAHGAHTHTLGNHVLPGNTPYDYAPSGGGIGGTHTLTRAAAEHAHMPMFGVHLVAAIASLGVLYSAERTLARLIRLLAMKVRALGAALFTPPAVLPLLGRRILLYIPNAPATGRVATLKYCRIERGPPAFV
jgi:possible integral membrane protein